MKLIVGLGNPGLQYSDTRHNMGRLVIEHIARINQLRFTKKKQFDASVVSFEWDGNPVILAYPETWMNLCGSVVGGLVRYYRIEPAKNLLVVVDDLALDFGCLRLRSKGSDGGHNGLKSIHSSLDSSEYARLRIGIGQPEKQECGDKSKDQMVVDYVLGKLRGEEKKVLSQILNRGSQACSHWVSQSISRAMNTVNALGNKVAST